MATKNSQRLAIWVIALALVVGTLGSFLVMVLAPKNQATQQARIDQLEKEYSEKYEDYQQKIAQRLSEKYYETFKQYESRVSPFDAAAVEELQTEDIKEGDGEELTAESSFTAYYLGWNPEGVVFDGSIDNDTQSLKVPFDVMPGQVIKGWTEGVKGMKVGGVRQLTIPSEMAYGEQGSGENIPPNTPLRFIIMVIPSSEKTDIEAELEEPEVPQELRDYYRRVYGMEL